MGRSWPAPTRTAHKTFVETEGWVERTTARGKEPDHLRYQLEIEGDILYTRISKPPSAKETYGKERWSHILRDQLKVTEEEFWTCVADGVLPERSRPQTPTGLPIPPNVVWTLIHEVRIPEARVKAMTRDEAIDRLHQFYVEGK